MNERDWRGQGVAQSAFDDLLETEQAFYRSVSMYLAHSLARLKVPKFLIEDLVQEAWVSAVQHRHQFTGDEIKCRVRCWLIKVVHGKAVDALRHLVCCHFESLPAEEIRLIDEAGALRAEAAELKEWLSALLETVRPSNEENVRLFRTHFIEGYSIQELAESSGMTEKSVDSRIRRLLQKVRAQAQ